MSSDQQQPHEGHGGWEPLPQGGEYEGDATAFVQLPDNLLDFRSVPRGADPLAAPGHGYVPPPIAQSHEQQPGDAQPGTGQWTMPFAEGQVPDPGGQWSPYDAQTPPGNGDWQDPDPAAPWTVPPASADVPDESGEYLVGGQDPYGTAPHPGGQHWTPGAPGAEWTGQQHAEPAPGGHWQHDSDGGGIGYADPSGGSDYTGDYDAAGGPTPDLTWDGGGAGWTAPLAGYPAGHDHAPADTGHPGPDGGSPGEDVPGQADEPDAWPAEPEPALDGGAPAPEDGVPGPQRHEKDPEPAGPSPEAPEDGFAAGPQEEPAAEPEPALAESAGEPAETTADETAGAPPAEDAAPPRQSPGPDDDAGEPAAGTDTAPPSEHPHTSYVLKVNGTDRPVTDAWIGESLLYVLRERLGLAGAKDGCSQGECGACSVLVDGRLVASCLVPAATAAASEVRTVEGLSSDGAGSDVQRALAAHGAVQCGFCVPGLAMTVHDLLEGNHAPSELETRQAISGNLCRCTGYRGVLEAVREIAADRAARAEQEGEEQAGRDRGTQNTGTVRIPHQAGPSDITDHPTGGPA